MINCPYSINLKNIVAILATETTTLFELLRSQLEYL